MAAGARRRPTLRRSGASTTIAVDQRSLSGSPTTGRTWSVRRTTSTERAPRALASCARRAAHARHAIAGGLSGGVALGRVGRTWVAQRLELPMRSRTETRRASSAMDGTRRLIGRNVDGPRAAVIWRSGDGISWSCHVIDASGLGLAQADRLHRAGARLNRHRQRAMRRLDSCIGYPMAWRLGWPGIERCP